jgi:GTPase SAR1 family protein
VYSITDQQSFERVTHWMDQIKELAPGDVKIVLVGNKSDLTSDRVVDEEQGKLIADKYGVPFYECSAYSGQNINAIFEKLGASILENFDREDDNSIPGIKKNQNKKNCC